MKFTFKFIDKLIAKPTKTNLMALNKFLSFGIPFNAPHGFKIKQMNAESVIIHLPNRRLNHNHLGGIHACAIATIGEFAAGMSLLSIFGISKYRPILSELSVKYTYQGRTDLQGKCLVDQIDKSAVHAALDSEGKYLQKLDTIITDKNGKEVAVVTTLWQLKSWNMVRTKN